jgi:hypothetical protein
LAEAQRARRNGGGTTQLEDDFLILIRRAAQLEAESDYATNLEQRAVASLEAEAEAAAETAVASLVAEASSDADRERAAAAHARITTAYERHYPVDHTAFWRTRAQRDAWEERHDSPTGRCADRNCPECRCGCGREHCTYCYCICEEEGCNADCEEAFEPEEEMSFCTSYGPCEALCCTAWERRVQRRREREARLERGRRIRAYQARWRPERESRWSCRTILRSGRGSMRGGWRRRWRVRQGRGARRRCCTRR